MEAGVVNSAQCRVGSVYTSRASELRARFHAWNCSSLRRDVSGVLSSGSGSMRRPLQNTHSGDHRSHVSASLGSSASPPSSSCLTIDRDILPGEVIDFPGMVLVKGDVNGGAAIHASGDIIVLGKLEGKAHAGRNGDTHTVIFAWNMASNAISIASHEVGLSSCNGDYLCKVAALSDNKVRIFDASSKDFRHLPSKSEHSRSPARTSFAALKSWFSIDVRSMRKASKVAAFTGAYIFIAGIALLLFPESLFGLLFDVKSGSRDWIRFVAVLAVVFGIYYIGTAWGDAKGYNGADSFYISTIVGRVFIFLSFWWLVVNGTVGLSLFAVGLIFRLNSSTYRFYSPLSEALPLVLAPSFLGLETPCGQPSSSCYIMVGTVNLLGAVTMLNALRKENLQRKSA